MQSPDISPVRFEALEPRQLRSADPSPGDGSDYHLSLDADGSVVQTASTEVNARKPMSAFTWYDGSHDTGLAPLSNDTIQAAQCAGWYCWPARDTPSVTRDSEPNEANVREWTRQIYEAGVHLVVIDNETWQFDIRYATTAQINHTIARMVEVFNWMHDEEPDIKVGLYGYMSQSDDTNSVKWSAAVSNAAEGSGWYQYNLPDYANSFAQWQATSEYLRPISAAVDYMFPALYTGTTDPDSWENSALITIEDTRRYGKPVIPFLMPFYHPGVGPALANTELPTDYWNRELNLVEQYADGAFIWTPGATDPNADWIQTLLQHTGGAVAAASPISAAPDSSGSDADDTHDTLNSGSRFADLLIDGNRDEDTDLFSLAA